MSSIDGAVVVTGSGAGTGRTIAMALGDLGMPVVIVDIDRSAAEQTAELMRTKGQRCDVVTGSVCTEEIVDQMLTVAESFEGGLAALINNAGGGGERPPHFPDAARDVWEAKVQLNLIAPMRASQAALKIMGRRGRGAIINVASTAGLGLNAYESPEYAAAKAGLIRFTSCFSDQPSVRVNCVVPGWIATERALAELAAMSDKERRAVDEPVPMSVVAAAIVDLLTDKAAMGRVVVLEGGKAPRALGTEGY